MSAVAERLREELRDRFRRLSLDERIRLVLELGERDVGLYSDARGIGREAAARALRAARRRGRRPSRCVEPVFD